MMSELGKEIMKAVPALELSTQDFILRSKNNLNPLPQSTAIRLSVSLQQSLNGCPSKITFNGDHKPYTPAFIDEACQPIFKDDDRFLREIFERKIVESTNSKLHLYEPRPSSDYCSICKESFPDYLKHVAHPVHRKNLAARGCQDYIGELCELVKLRVRRSVDLERGEELLSLACRKRRKTEEGKCFGGEVGSKAESGNSQGFQSQTI